jgi:hypothetical protein
MGHVTQANQRQLPTPLGPAGAGEWLGEGRGLIVNGLTGTGHRGPGNWVARLRVGLQDGGVLIDNWPLRHLRLTTERLVLRQPGEEELAALANVAAGGLVAGVRCVHVAPS